MNIRRLRPEDAESLMSLRREALETEPLAFGSSPADDRFRSREFVENTLADSHDQAVFGCIEAGDLVGIFGVMRGSKVKERHKAHAWGMYVAPAARRKGVGRALLNVAIEQARGWAGVEQLQLSVTESAIAARALYESAGFTCWGREPRALANDGRVVDEFYLVLRFDSSSAREQEEHRLT